MKWVLLIYEVVLLGILGYLALYPNETTGALAFKCGIAGGIGGALYCIRGLYLNVSVKDQWESRWNLWYVARPLASVVMGVITYIFIRAGLLVLEATDLESSTQYGYMTLAFLAGLNVDNFIKKFETIAESSFGVGRSRASKREEK